MARQEDDREDLLSQATALAHRAELRVTGGLQPITLGFRRDGGFAVFFGADPVYQFNPRGELRRAFVTGLLYKAERGTLVALRRERGAAETTLLRRSLACDEQRAFTQVLEDHLQDLKSSLENQQFERLGCIPAEVDVYREALQWLNRHSQIAIAEKPNAGS